MARKRTSQRPMKQRHEKKLIERPKILIKFSYGDKNKHQLFEWTKEELKCFVKTLKRLESHDNVSCQTDGSLRLKKISPFTFPNYISPDVICTEIRCSKKQRLLGFFDENIYHIVWFDRNHEET